VTTYQAFGIKKVWTFLSESNPNKKYETLLYADKSTSCNCPGWTRRFKNGIRTCKHTRMVDMGTANQECANFHDYDKAKKEVYQTSEVSNVVNQYIKSKPQYSQAKPAPVKATKPAPVADVENMELSMPIVRKIQW